MGDARDGKGRQPAPAGVLGVRLLGLGIAAVGLWQLIANVCDTFRDFDPSYIGYYFASQMLRPLLGIAIGAALLLLSRRIGARIGRL